MTRVWFRYYHLVFGIIGLATFIYDVSRNTGDIINYLSYFSPEVIVFTSLLFIYIGLVRKPRIGNLNIDIARGAVAIYTLTSGVIFWVYLSGIYDPTAIAWVNFVFHKVIPVAAVFGWLIFPPRMHLGFKNILIWLIFPVLYVFYSLARGFIINWYPYFFLNPEKSGYLEIFSFSLKLLAVGLGFSIVLVAIGNVLSAKSGK